MKAKGVCCSCGREVLANNNTLLLELIVDKILRYGEDYTEEQVGEEERVRYHVAYEFNPWRHLWPVVEFGKVVCQGTPSSAQYLDDSLSKQSNYDANNKARYLNAYNRMLVLTAVLMAVENKNAPRA